MTEPKDLLLFALGPVQSYLVTARRTSDLWYGSQMLSRLAQTGVERAARAGVELLFPVRRDNGDWPANIPNRFLALMPPGRGQEIAPMITQAVKEEWTRLANQARNHFSHLSPADGWEAIWDRQVNGWLETYWVAWPWDGQSDYGVAYRQVCLALDARKDYRPYPTATEPGEKCTLCGEREALRGEQTARRGVQEFWKSLRPRAGLTQIAPGERLCAICAIKRFAGAAKLFGQDRSFPSTSSIASAPFRAEVAHRPELTSVVDNYLVALRPFQGEKSLEGLDGRWLYRETFTPERLEEELGHKLKETDRIQAIAALDKLIEAAARFQIAPPHHYLAVLQGDGDQMGKLLSEKAKTPADHGRISQALTDLAGRMSGIIGKHHGRVIYAGGDDLLALLPVASALTAANDVRQAFSQALADAGYAGQHLSAGLAISHYIQPLQGALYAARDAEHVAKEECQRNALAVRALRRSGEAQTTATRWQLEGDAPSPLEEMQQVQDLIRAGYLSSKLAYAVEAEAAILDGIPTAQEAELGRLLKRHTAEKVGDDEKKKIAALARPLTRLAEAWGENGMQKLAGWLKLAQFLARGEGV